MADEKDKTQFNRYKSEGFKWLVSNFSSLFSAIENDPDITKRQDENGNTIAHHVVIEAISLGKQKISGAIPLLCGSKLDLSIKNKDGETPLHLAAAYHCNTAVCENIFPAFVARAANTGFDFSTRNNAGKSVLHIAAMQVISDSGKSAVETIDHHARVVDGKDVSIVDWNGLSETGGTPFFYAINHSISNINILNNAKYLLNLGVDFKLCGSENKNPLQELENLKLGVQRVYGKNDERLERIEEFKKLIPEKFFIKEAQASPQSIKKSVTIIEPSKDQTNPTKRSDSKEWRDKFPDKKLTNSVSRREDSSKNGMSKFC